MTYRKDNLAATIKAAASAATEDLPRYVYLDRGSCVISLFPPPAGVDGYLITADGRVVYHRADVLDVVADRLLADLEAGGHPGAGGVS